jgi:hypothetical protein
MSLRFAKMGFSFFATYLGLVALLLTGMPARSWAADTGIIIKIVPEKWEIGSMEPGKEYTKPVIITNIGSGDLLIDQVTASNPDIHTTLKKDPIGFYLLTITVVPTDSRSHVFNEVIHISSNDPHSGLMDIAIIGDMVAHAKDNAKTSVPTEMNGAEPTGTVQSGVTPEKSALIPPGIPVNPAPVNMLSVANPVNSDNTVGVAKEKIGVPEAGNSGRLSEKLPDSTQSGTPTENDDTTLPLSQTEIAKLHAHKDGLPPLIVHLYYLGRCLYCLNKVRVMEHRITEEFDDRVIFLAGDWSRKDIRQIYDKVLKEFKLPLETQALSVIGGKEYLAGIDETYQGLIDRIKKHPKLPPSSLAMPQASSQMPIPQASGAATSANRITPTPISTPSSTPVVAPTLPPPPILTTTNLLIAALISLIMLLIFALYKVTYHKVMADRDDSRKV